MMAWIAKVASACWMRATCRDILDLDDNDALVWSKDLERHSCGQYSFAVCQANPVLEDFSQVETGTNAILVGVYDGHGGHEVAEFVCNRLFNEVTRLAQTQGNISQVTLGGAVAYTENEFLELVRNNQGTRPNIACMGTCCLVGVIWKGTLLIANLGDSRAVLGYTNHLNMITAEALTEDHNVNREEIRQLLSLTNTDDPNLVIHRNGAYRIKGIIQVSKSIGDAYMKHPDFAPHPSLERFQLPHPITNQPAISSEPSLYTRALHVRDKFLIFASDGLWDCLTNQEAVEIVNKYPRRGIARRLIKAAQIAATRRANIPYKQLRDIDRGTPRRDIHDDITVVVVYINHELLGHKIDNTPNMSIKGFNDVPGESTFASINGLM